MKCFGQIFWAPKPVCRSQKCSGYGPTFLTDQKLNTQVNDANLEKKYIAVAEM